MLLEAARRLQREVAAAIKRHTRQPHSDNAKRPEVGGSLSRQILESEVVGGKGNVVTIHFNALGQKLLWFVRGTTHQKPRPIPEVPDIQRLVADLEAAAAKRFEEHEREQERRRR